MYLKSHFGYAFWIKLKFPKLYLKAHCFTKLARFAENLPPRPPCSQLNFARLKNLYLTSEEEGCGGGNDAGEGAGEGGCVRHDCQITRFARAPDCSVIFASKTMTTHVREAFPKTLHGFVVYSSVGVVRFQCLR